MKTNVTLNLNLSTIILVGVIVFLFLFGGYRAYNNKVDEYEKKVESEIKLRDALVDTVVHYQNKEKAWVAAKLAIQSSIENLELINAKLTENQRELIERIKEVNKKNNIITAALVQTQVKIDSLIHEGETVVDTNGGRIIFSDHFIDGKKELRYRLTISNVKPLNLFTKPTLLFDSIYFPNKQFVEFHWIDDKKEGYPISFTVTNSNDYFKTTNIDSYVIPKIDKQEIDPNFGKRMKNFFKKSGDKVVWTAVGVGVGTALVLILRK